MNKQELIERIEGLKNIFGNKVKYIEIDAMIELVSKLDEPETGHADEAPRYVKNILARLRELPLHDREVWLKAIMSEFEQDFCHAKWREGYEQGKFDGEWVGNQLKDADKIRCELNREKVPQFVADWYEENKDDFETSLFQCIYEIFGKRNDSELNEFENWVIDENIKPFQTLVNMHQFGYEVEKEKRYRISMPKARNYKNHAQILCEKDGKVFWCGEWHSFRTEFTRKELEAAGFGWVFDCPGIEVEEVE